MVVFKTNGIRFNKTDNTYNNYIDLEYLKRPHVQQRYKGDVFNCFRQPIDFTSISRVQVWTANTPTLRIYNSSNVLLSTLSFANSNTIEGKIVWNLTINWASVAGVGLGSYITLTDTVTFYRSETLWQPPYPLLKFVYSNNKFHSSYGDFKNCFEQICYIDGQITDYKIPQKREVYEDASGVINTLTRKLRKTFNLKINYAPEWIHDILHSAINSDKLLVERKPVAGVITYDNLSLLDESEYEIDDYNRANIATAACVLALKNTFLRRITSFNNTYIPQNPEILNESNITNTSFRANWTGVNADSYEVQISTSSNFAAVTTYATANNFYDFTGLTTCLKYYYRVRALNCGGVSAWTVATNVKQASIHFRGVDRWKVLEFTSEKIVDLSVLDVFSNLVNLRYKFAPALSVTKATWDSIYGYRTLVQIQSDINASAGTYSIYFDCDDFVLGSDGGLAVQYVTDSFITTGCLTYVLSGISQDVFVWLKDKVQIDSITSSAGGTLSYDYVTNMSNDFTAFDLANLTALNNAIVAGGAPYAFGIYLRYSGTNITTTLTINLRYI